jgi:hypothetical protein
MNNKGVSFFWLTLYSIYVDVIVDNFRCILTRALIYKRPDIDTYGSEQLWCYINVFITDICICVYIVNNLAVTPITVFGVDYYGAALSHLIKTHVHYYPDLSGLSSQNWLFGISL